MFKRIDRIGDRLTRRAASSISRRSLLSRMGTALMAGAVMPALPMTRKAHGQEPAYVPTPAGEIFARDAQTADNTACNYWRYCASDGYLCSCCGGGPANCPAGTTPSPTSWVGSCINPEDSKTYLIAYRDCCGKDSCSKCACLGLEGEMPVYRPQLNNDIIWCFGASSMVYHCSSAAIVGEA
jgi:methylamine dehydrogenase light chain